MTPRKLKVLFVCVRNGTRSQMAEAFANTLCPDIAEASSAGLEPGTLNPLAVQVMQEVGIDISQAQCKSVIDLFKTGQRFDRVISVCDQTAAERCPLFPGLTVRLHWSFEDPSHTTGSADEVLKATREVRDALKKQIETWAEEERAGIVAEAALLEEKKLISGDSLGEDAELASKAY